MWQYQRQMSLNPRPMQLLFKGVKVSVDAQGWLVSDLTPELEKVLKASPSAWLFVSQKTEEQVVEKPIKPMRSAKKQEVKPVDLEPSVMIKDKEEV